MFEETLRLLRELEQPMQYTMEVLPDEDGYFDKECPNEECLSKFKVYAEDWKNLFSDEAVHCPFCGKVAPAKSWWTTEQVEQAKEQAISSVATSLNRAIKDDCDRFNRSQSRNSLIKLQMNFTGRTSFVNLPSEALDEMEQKIQCEKCGVRYAVIGSAFYCPNCGNNSARLTFHNTLNKVKAKIKNIDNVRNAIPDKDEAERTCSSLIESSVPDLVVAFQRVCECVYPQLDSAAKLKRNVFQRLDDGDSLWRNLLGEGYTNWISEDDYALMKKCFQQRHLFQHQDGIVDEDYLSKSGDTTYKVGQHLIVKTNDILVYTDIIEKLGNKVLSLLQEGKDE